MNVVAVYLRLSVEDKNNSGNGTAEDGSPAGRKNAWEKGRADESNSILNQRLLVHSYIEQDAGLKKYCREEYCDDGWSGSSMDRPGMNRLLDEVKKNHVQCIVVKDRSRFSRDYIELGTYLNRIFPFMGVRFIAVADHYDSREHKDNTIGLDTAFKTLLNDLYSKDISVKVKASLGNRYAAGEYAFGQVPFGYEKSAGRIDEQGKIKIHCCRMDQILRGKQVDFIKMDVEGAELRALEGSKEIIKKNRPNLAVCVYHKPEDYFEIPLWIKQVYPGYKLYFRQYELSDTETICYAIGE